MSAERESRHHALLADEPGRSILLGLFALAVVEVRAVHHVAVLVVFAKFLGVGVAALGFWTFAVARWGGADWDSSKWRAWQRTPPSRTDASLLAMFVGLIVASVWIPSLFGIALVIGIARPAAGLSFFMALRVLPPIQKWLE